MCLVTQSCLTVFDPMDCNIPGSSVHGDSPGKNTGGGCHSLPQGSSQSRDQTQASCIAGRFFTIWATREVQIYNNIYYILEYYVYRHIWDINETLYEFISTNTVKNSLVSRNLKKKKGREITSILGRVQNLSTQFATEVFSGSAKFLWINDLSLSHRLCLALAQRRPHHPSSYTGHWLSNILCCAAWTTIQFPCSQSE